MGGDIWGKGKNGGKMIGNRGVEKIRKQRGVRERGKNGVEMG